MFEFASEVEMRPKVLITLGGQYKLDQSTEIKCKASSNSVIGIGLIKSLNKYVSIKVSSEVDVKQVFSSSLTDFKLRTSVDINC